LRFASVLSFNDCDVHPDFPQILSIALRRDCRGDRFATVVCRA
jgi:hypothetical protein